jgi:ubiquinone/menaquinone biosynthesis C-methylase UbiE
MSAWCICAGARQGTEVEVLRDLGYSNAKGIDLNPGPDNPFVLPGDFMHMEYPDSSIDLIYSNCLDHSFDLDGFFREHARVIKPDGLVLYEIMLDCKERAGSYEVAVWDSDTEIIKLMLNYFSCILHVEEDDGWKWILLRGKR